VVKTMDDIMLEVGDYREGGPKQRNISVIYRASTREFCGYRTGRKNYCKRLCVGMEIPCRLVFSCLNKVKIIRFKELLESKIR